MTSIGIVVYLALNLKLDFAIAQYSYPYYSYPFVQNPVVSVIRAVNRLCWYGEWIDCRLTPRGIVTRSYGDYNSDSVVQQLYTLSNDQITQPQPIHRYQEPYIDNLQKSNFIQKPNVHNNLPLRQDWTHLIKTDTGKMLNVPQGNSTFDRDKTINLLNNGKIENTIVLPTEVPDLEVSATEFYTVQKPNKEVPVTAVTEPITQLENETTYNMFLKSLDQFERKFFKVTFDKLSSISPPERSENGISFVQSGLLLYLVLTTVAMQEDQETRKEIENCLDFPIPNKDKVLIMKRVTSSLPTSSDFLKLRWSSRLVLSTNVSHGFQAEVVNASGLNIKLFNDTLSSTELTKSLNRMVEVDSGGSMHNTFEEDEFAEGARAVLMSVAYVRARWRSAPTLLNGTWPFNDAVYTPQRSTRMLRINDIMRYADLPDWDAEVLEISYATPGLSLLLLLPRGRSLRALSARLAQFPLTTVTDRMQTLRIVASLPLFTLRMTLLLPNKLQAMGVSRLVDTNGTRTEELRLSHAVQRLMFWAEAGRNAFKDDGIEWDDPPNLQIVVDRPYVFYIRWNNLTLINGNFAL